MPKSSSAHGRKFVPKQGAEEIVRSAITAAEAIVPLPILDIHKTELLKHLLYKVTEAHGKYTTRFRSAGAMAGDGSEIQHEHVIPRKVLVDEMVKHPGQCSEVMLKAIGCVVTKEEHDRLTKISKDRPDLQGWDRYKAAGIEVRDMAE